VLAVLAFFEVGLDLGQYPGLQLAVQIIGEVFNHSGASAPPAG
jgi:hypothetical protein